MGQTVIEINGVRYDATTGKVVETSTQTPKQSPNHASKGHSIDGIVGSAQMKPIQHESSPVLAAPKLKFKPTLTRNVHDVAMVHHKHASRSKTLMRTIVKKPGASHLSPASAPVQTVTTQVQRTPSYSSATHHSARLEKAINTPTHADIARFRQPAHTKLRPTISTMPVATEPKTIQPSNAPEASQFMQHSQKAQRTQTSSDFVSSQLSSSLTVDEVSPFKKKPLRVRLSGAFKKSKLRTVAAISMSTLLLGGFIAYQNMPTILLTFANRNSGIAAKIPQGIPSNFKISNKITASQGRVALSFSSRTDDRNFTLTQESSNMNSEELESILASSGRVNLQTYETNGIKLFITGPGSADWIDGGIRYVINGTSGLTSEQLAMIAKSL